MTAEGRRIARLDEQATALLGVFARAGYDRIDTRAMLNHHALEVDCVEEGLVCGAISRRPAGLRR